MNRVASERKQIEPRPAGRRVQAQQGQAATATPTLGAWALPLPTIDPQVVMRSARALERYGPDFTYGHFAAVKHLPVALAGVAGVASLFTLAAAPAGARLPARPDGVGRRPVAAGAREGLVQGEVRRQGRRRAGASPRSSGGDPGYGETSKMLAESALCLAHDDLPETAGQVTTAVAMGGTLRERLERAGIAFRT